MRPVSICAVVLFAACVSPAAPAGSPTLTIVLDFQGKHSVASTIEMKREFGHLMKDVPLRFDWRSRAEVAQLSIGDLVVVRFNGTCVLDADSHVDAEPGPLAFSYSAGGLVQPFAAVACDRVTATVQQAMGAASFNLADRLLGRALGRVLAHEVVHMLTRSAEHGSSGISKPALSGSELIAPNLRLDPAERERLSTALGPEQPSAATAIPSPTQSGDTKFSRIE